MMSFYSSNTTLELTKNLLTKDPHYIRCLKPNAVISSAVFATNAQSDLGSVTDEIIAFSEDLGYIEDLAALIYDMGQLKLDGIVSLSNIDQSVKADYIGYSIIFGF